MHARVVRFTDASRDRIDEIAARIRESGGPPEGVDSTGMKLLFDEAQGTAVFIGFFDSAEALEASEAVLAGMDASETPGTRASVDRCEVAIEMDSA